jgi:AcrR family transcriptional regulator
MATVPQVERVQRRRDRQREETRHDLALAAFEMARQRGLANVRVPEIALAVGVSTRTFNNYFASKEQAIAWPAVQHAATMADILLQRPADEPLGAALVEAVTGVYLPQERGLPPHWLRDFRSLVAREPALHGEYLKASQAAERALADAIAQRMHLRPGDLRVLVIAAMAVGAERAAVMHWMASPKGAARTGSLVQTVRAAVTQAVAGIDGRT